MFKARFEDQSEADFRNATLAFAILGGVLGVALGVAGGLARGHLPNGLRAGGAGLILGTLLGAGSSLLFLPVYFRALSQAQEEVSRDIVMPLMVHGGIWAACGVAGGAALGMGVRGTRNVLKGALGGLIGAALGAALYEMIGAAALPTARTTIPIPPGWESRLLARLLVASLTGFLAANVISMPSQRSQ
jgi:hypothetical protein